MLGPEMPGSTKSAKILGGSPVSLYLLVESAEKVFAKALKLGATVRMPVMDMFLGDRCGSVIDPEGYQWSVGTHIAEPTPQEMKKKMKEQMALMAPVEGFPTSGSTKAGAQENTPSVTQSDAGLSPDNTASGT